MEHEHNSSEEGAEQMELEQNTEEKEELEDMNRMTSRQPLEI